jgi:aspartate/methionine/tyrosine aminotransferase
VKLSPFLLDQWLEQKLSAKPPIDYDLAASTGPVWTLRDLLALADEREQARLLDTTLVYTAAAGSTALREAIATLQEVDPDEVQVVTGAAEALLVLFFLAAEPGANVVLPFPGFPPNTALPKSLGLEVRCYTLRAENGFRVDLDELQSLVDRHTRIVLVNSPHNPTGAVLSEQEMQRVHDFCAARRIQFVADEVYHPIYHGPAMPSAARLRHTTVLGDFSKALCLSGLRVGWIVERDPEQRARYMNARSYFTVSNTVLGERLATLAVQHREAIYGRARRVASTNLALLDQLFTEYGDVLRWVRPRGGMTAFPWLAGGGDAREFCRRLATRGLLLAPGDCFGTGSHFRLGFAASGDDFPRALERLAAFLRTEAPRRARTAV